jgi:hypothetical protein
MCKRLTILTAAVLLAATTGLLAAHAQPVVTISLPEPGAAKELYTGCNAVAVTFPNGTSSQTVANAVTPAGSLQAIWSYDTAQQRFTAFSPAAPQASDLLSVNFLDAVWVCVAGAPPAPAAVAPTVAPLPPPSPATPPSSKTTYMGTHSGGGTIEFNVSADGQLVLTFMARGFCGDPGAVLGPGHIRIMNGSFYWEAPFYDRFRIVSGTLVGGEAYGNISYHDIYGCHRDRLTWTAYAQYLE